MRCGAYQDDTMGKYRQPAPPGCHLPGTLKHLGPSAMLQP